MSQNWHYQIEEPLGADCGDLKAPRCPKCGYDLRGSSTGRCAECGYRPTKLELREASDARTRQMFELEDLHFKLRVGCWFGGVGAMGIALSRWIGLTVAVSGPKWKSWLSSTKTRTSRKKENP